MTIMEKDINFGRTQLLNYKEETVKLRDTKKILLSTLKKSGIEIPNALLASTKGNGEPISDKELEEMTNKISNSTKTNNGNKGFNAPHSNLDHTQS